MLAFLSQSPLEGGAGGTPLLQRLWLLLREGDGAFVRVLGTYHGVDAVKNLDLAHLLLWLRQLLLRQLLLLAGLKDVLVVLIEVGGQVGESVFADLDLGWWSLHHKLRLLLLLHVLIIEVLVKILASLIYRFRPREPDHSKSLLIADWIGGLVRDCFCGGIWPDLIVNTCHHFITE